MEEVNIIMLLVRIKIAAMPEYVNLRFSFPSGKYPYASDKYVIIELI